ncbi:MAG TPA: AI-2E family transporter [Trichocoleus sp.]
MTNQATQAKEKITSRLPRWLLILLSIPLVVLNGWVVLQVFKYFGSIVTVLAIATLLAFLLNFPVQFLEKRGIQRGYSILLVFLTFLGILATLGITLLPLLSIQLQELVLNLPDRIDAGSEQLQRFQDWASNRRLPINVSGIVTQLESLVPQEVNNLPNRVFEIVLETVDSVLEVILAVALTLYLMLHGQEFWNSIFQWLPLQVSSRVRQSLNQNFRNYFIGQFTIALIQGTVLTIVFFFLRIPSFLLFGMGVGLLGLIPFFDVLGVLLVSLIVVLTNFWLGVAVLVIALLVDQVIDNTVSPRVIGKLIGLNPVWVIISLLLGAKIAGFVGILLAVPLSSTIADIIADLQTEPELPLVLPSEMSD